MFVRVHVCGMLIQLCAECGTFNVCVCDCAFTEWIEEHSSAAAPLANYAPNHLETYRDPQVPPTLPPGPAGAKSKSLFFILCCCFINSAGSCDHVSAYGVYISS